MINPIGSTGTQVQTQVKAAENQQVKATENPQVKSTEKTIQTQKTTSTDPKTPMATDILDIGKPVEKSGNYNKPTTSVDMSKIEALQKKADEALQPLREMVKQLLKEQGKTFREARVDTEDQKVTDEDTLVTITPEIRAEAQKNIAEDGEYGIEKTATRLADFAKSISNGDPKKLDVLKKAIQDGYDAAEKAFGGELPDISKKTLELTMKKLDEWASMPAENQSQLNVMK